MEDLIQRMARLISDVDFRVDVADKAAVRVTRNISVASVHPATIPVYSKNDQIATLLLRLERAPDEAIEAGSRA